MAKKQVSKASETTASKEGEYIAVHQCRVTTKDGSMTVPARAVVPEGVEGAALDVLLEAGAIRKNQAEEELPEAKLTARDPRSTPDKE